MWRRAWLAILLCPFAYSATPAKPFIDCTREELAQAIPDLAGLQFDSNQAALEGLLSSAGGNLENSFANFVKVSATEQIDELRFDRNMSVETRKEAFQYDIALSPPGSGDLFQEVRLDPGTKSPVRPADNQFLVLSYFYKVLSYMLPGYQNQSQFRYLGQLDSGDQHYFVVAFAQHSDSRLKSHVAIAPGRSALIQGIVWIDAAGSTVVRVHADLLGSVGDFPLQTLSTDIALAPVTFQAAQAALLLPARITVDATSGTDELHTVHRYGGYQAGGETVAAAAASGPDDAYEVLAQGIASAKNGDATAAIGRFRASLRLSSAIPATHFNLANALIAANDSTGAETELREGLKLVPESVLFHDLLGVVLGKRGDTAGAVAEFRASIQIAPKEASLHSNLANSLASTGDRAGAIAEFRIASELAPDNATFKSQLARLESAASALPTPSPSANASPANTPSANPPETIFRTEVRQVLVPVIVTDKDGHHVTGLTQSDFHIFEDGVEQKITAFSAEDSSLAAGTSAPSGAQGNARSEQSNSQPATAKPQQIRETYLICIDTLHSAQANLMSFREPLLKFFRGEHSTDSQYSLVAMGTALEPLQQATPDRDKILKAIEGKEYQKVWKDSRMAAGNFDLAEFRERLQVVRTTCDSPSTADQSLCDEEKDQLPKQAKQLASEDLSLDTTYLAQLRRLVETLKDAPGRRSIVLVSDGFSMVPGKEPLELLMAYFPEFRAGGGAAAADGVSLGATDRMSDLDPVLRMASNNNIPIYTIDSRGAHASQYFDVSSSGAPASGKTALGLMGALDRVGMEAGATLTEIADATGGTSFGNNNDLMKGLQLAVADGRQYYMVSYVSTNNKSDGKFRKIGVKLADPKMLPKAKRGYWATPN